jgi:hypothetical protein
MMPVVAALDLDDQVPSGDRPDQVHGVHRGLGARVGEPPGRQAEPASEFLGDRERVARRLGEMGTERDLPADRFDDGRVTVAGQRGAITAVQVDILVAVDVVELRALAVTEPHRLRAGDLPARGDPARQRGGRLRRHPARLRLPGREDLLLPGDDIFE